MAQWCTSWDGQPWPCVRAPGTKPRGIMCLLVGVVARVQAPRWVVCQRFVLSSSFGGCGSSNLEPPTMGIAVALSSIAAAIPLHALVTNDGSLESQRPPPSIHMVGRSLGGQLRRRQAASLAPSNLRRDSKAPARWKRKLSNWLI